MKQKGVAFAAVVIVAVLVAGYFASTYSAKPNPSNTQTPNVSPTDTSNTTAPSDTSPTSSPQVTNVPEETASPSLTDTPTPTPAPTESGTPGPSPSGEATPTPSSSGTPTPTPTPSPSNGTIFNGDYSSYIVTSNASTTSVAAVLAENKDDHENAQDYTWSATGIIDITLSGNSISVTGGTGATVSGTIVTITSAGTYRVTGTLNDGQIFVNATSQAVVKLVLNGAKITCTTNAPIYSAVADKLIIILATNTQNEVTDNAASQNDAAIYCKTDLSISGDGSLSVTGNRNDGIRSNDGLIIKSGNIHVTSVDDGICGKDYVVIKGGTITVNSVGDGLKSDDDQTADRGYISIEQGTIAITSTNGDAVSAETDLLITSGTLTATTGGGSQVTPGSTSTKGLKGQVSVIIDNGNFTINASDDAIHSNGTIVINNGKFTIATGDDAVHADKYLEVNGGSFAITQCFEGLESEALIVNNGYFQITASDDGINAAGGNDNSSTDWRPGQPSWPWQGGAPALGNFSLRITGGFIYIDATGDGLDINGQIEVTNGVLIINGPLSNMNGAIDYDTTFKMSGGTLIAVGSSGMAMAPSAASTQYSVLARFSTTQQAGKLITIQTSSGTPILTFSPTKTYQSIAYCSPKLTPGSYELYLGGTCTGSSYYGVYEGGTYSGGTRYRAFTVSSIVTNIT